MNGRLVLYQKRGRTKLPVLQQPAAQFMRPLRWPGKTDAHLVAFELEFAGFALRLPANRVGNRGKLALAA